MQATAERHRRAENVLEYNFQQARENDLEAAAKEYKALQRQIEELKSQLEETKKVITEGMNGQETVTAGVYKISNKSYTSRRLDTDTFKAVHPDIYTLFCKTSTSTRFEIR
jgi:predicted phage-related endonuclease